MENKFIDCETIIKNLWTQKCYEKKINYNKKKMFVTLSCPYIDGLLHLGHAYTILKADIITRYYELHNYNVLLTFPFQVTGLFITSNVNQLKKEMMEYNINELNNKNNKKLKENGQIMRLLKMGVNIDIIKNFTDPNYWIKYFSKKAKDDLIKFGINIDFNRSFITTNEDPYYDLFIKWQFDRFYKDGHLYFEKKNIIYSPKNKQICVGQDCLKKKIVNIKKYLVLKCKIDDIANYYLLIMVTRPEILYATTNIWANENNNYYVIKIKNETKDNFDQYYVCSINFIKNLFYQQYNNFDDIEIIEILKGHKLINKTVILPKIFNNKIIPILSGQVNMNRGTGFNFCIPGHRIYDYIYYLSQYNINSKNKFQKMHNNITSIIKVGDNDNYALDILKKELGFNNKSINKINIDINSIKKIKQNIFKKENNDGIMLVGKYKSFKTIDARKKIKHILITNKIAIKYYEPKNVVRSRTGDRCIVASKYNWYVNYNNEDIKKKVDTHIKQNLNTFNEKIKNLFIDNFNLIDCWPCSRSYGLGIKLLNTEFIIDPITESTMHSALHTIYNSLKKIPIEAIDNEIWNYIFLNGIMPKEFINGKYKKYNEFLINSKKEFNYWYSPDLKISGKDLILDHIIDLYHNFIMWKKDDYLPKHYYINGNLLFDNNKISKGTLIYLRETIEKYGVDSTRFTLMKEENGINDIYLLDENIKETIIVLTTELDWIKKTINEITKINQFNLSYNILDSIFNRKINMCIEKCDNYYKKMEFNNIIKEFYNILNIKNEYSLENMNYILIQKYIEAITIILNPICPHWTQTIWNYSKTKNIIFKETWFELEYKI